MERVGLAVDVRPVDVDEEPQPGESADQTAQRLAVSKAQAAERIDDARPILAADTIVSIHDEQLGKPADEEEARAMLRRLSGDWHEVVTAVALLLPGHAVRTALARTRVRFADLYDEEIERYAATDEPYDKAGAYAVQGAGSWFVESIAGSSSNVVGLPLELVRRLLLDADLGPPSLRPTEGSEAGATGRGDDPI
jgi:septum formation protein